MITMVIKKNANNSLGNGYAVSLDGYYERYYYGYSKREAERLYRKEFNLKGRHFEKIDLTKYQ